MVPKGQVVRFVYMQMQSGWGSPLIGAKACMKMRVNLKLEAEREEKNTSYTGFSSPSQIFPSGHQNQSLKVLVTPKQFNHCFDNSGTPTHSSSG